MSESRVLRVDGKEFQIVTVHAAVKWSAVVWGLTVLVRDTGDHVSNGLIAALMVNNSLM